MAQEGMLMVTPEIEMLADVCREHTNIPAEWYRFARCRQNSAPMVHSADQPAHRHHVRQVLVLKFQKIDREPAQRQHQLDKQYLMQRIPPILEWFAARQPVDF